MNNLFRRKYTVQLLFIIVALILAGRLFYIQVINDKYFLSANSNVLRKIFTYPARGVVTDRNGHIIAENEPVYDLMVTPNEVKPFDTLLLCKTLGIDTTEFTDLYKKAKAKSAYREGLLIKQLSVETYAALQEIMAGLSGFRVQKRTIRYYPDSVGAHMLGYVKEVTDKDIENSNYYRPGDYIGKSGLEKSYENILRGQRGITNMVYDVHNQPQGSYAKGRFDTLAASGAPLKSTIDVKLQQLGEALMAGKVGSVVAIEPQTGEILSYVSSPTYDPNKMVGRALGNNMMDLYSNPKRVFLNRPIQGYYPPGSVFKPIQALIALQQGLIDSNTTFYCPHYYMAGKRKVKCEHFDGPTNLAKGMAHSCNTYACYVFQKLMLKNGAASQKASYEDWYRRIKQFGFGTKLGIDLPFEKKGILLTRNDYDERWRGRWGYTSVISLAIGQGEITATPLQMANAMAIIANHGYYYRPHLVKQIGKDNRVRKAYTQKIFAGVDEQHYPPVITGMYDAVNSKTGTAYLSRIWDIAVCGKTGTVQNPHGKNHSVFIGFAPRNNPKIAIAVVVENAGYGGAYAAPIASFMIEQYIRGNVKSRAGAVQHMMRENLIDLQQPPATTKPPLADSAAKNNNSLPRPFLANPPHSVLNTYKKARS